MDLRGLLTFLVSLLLLIVSSWMVGTFMRLRKASTQYKTEKVFANACYFSYGYMRTGLFIGFVTVALSLLLVVISSISLYRSG